MSIKRYLKFMLLATGLCWLALLIVVFNVDPFSASHFDLALFYSSLIFSLIGFFSIVGLIFRGHLTSDPTHKKVTTAFRQSVWFACLIVFFLFLQGFRLLYWWNLILFVLFLILLEFFFISHRQSES